MSSTHCFLRTENRSICHGVVRPNFKLAIHFNASVTCACTGYALGPFRETILFIYFKVHICISIAVGTGIFFSNAIFCTKFGIALKSKLNELK